MHSRHTLTQILFLVICPFPDHQPDKGPQFWQPTAVCWDTTGGKTPFPKKGNPIPPPPPSSIRVKALRAGGFRHTQGTPTTSNKKRCRGQERGLKWGKGLPKPRRGNHSSQDPSEVVRGHGQGQNQLLLHAAKPPPAALRNFKPPRPA